ncbi:MAG TPA: ATP-binding protein [Nevskiaceae bacterium]|nr:ATP-binding protein [Nevskiaceae bacterium]
MTPARAEIAADSVALAALREAKRLLAAKVEEVERLSRLLQEREARFRELADHGSTIIFRAALSAGLPLLYVSRAVERITGWPVSALLEAPLLFGSRIEAADQQRLAIEASLAGDGRSWQTRFRFQRADGETLWLESECRRVELGDGQPVLEGSIRDITHSQVREQALRDHAETLERASTATLAAAIAPYTWLIDEARLECGALAHELHGLPKNSPTLRHLSDHWVHVPAAEREALEAELARALEAGGSYLLQYRVVTPSGRLRWLRSIGQIVDSPSRRLIGAVTDTTLEIEVQRALEARSEELERANAELDEFTYVASHDLKEPLRGIHNYARFLAEDYGERLDGEGRRMLLALGEQAERMQRLIEDLLSVARLGREPMSRRPVNLDELLRSILASLAFALKEKQAELTLEPLGSLSCDGVRVGEVFRNLITNALKYTDKPVAQLAIGRRETAEGSEFFVRDNGLGIRPEHLQRIFLPFKRLHNREAYGGGSGVGLAIVKRIVEAHGGTIRVDSTPGEGSTFRFTLGSG